MHVGYYVLCRFDALHATARPALPSLSLSLRHPCNAAASELSLIILMDLPVGVSKFSSRVKLAANQTVLVRDFDIVCIGGYCRRCFHRVVDVTLFIALLLDAEE